ncbi:MAG: ABC transporter ATP-binding protein [Actinomycetota bacterium]|nr:ABC transporter ATP-binding protein [Actinomycetota bacterium]
MLRTRDHHRSTKGPGVGDGVADAVLLQGVVSTIGAFPVLAGIDLQVAVGEVVLISGPNGAGKTSLLRLIAGQLPVTAGRAVVLGHDLEWTGKAQRRHTALVAQETFCYDDLSVRRNLRLHALVAGTTDLAADEAIELMHLTDVADMPHGHLSTGQRRRCALAVGLARRARLLLLDEPHAGLDPQSRGLVDGILSDVRSRGGTVLVVSHELERVRPLVDREIVVEGGCTAPLF